MRNSLHIIFIYTITMWLLNSCYHTERFESHVFLVTHDTLCLDAYAYPLSLISLEHSAKYNDGYYCLFDKSGLYRGMYSSGRAPFMLAISDKLSETSQLPSPDSFLQWSDFFVYSDTLFWKNQFGKASFWEETTSQWVPVKPLADIVYEDLDWQIAVLDGGEFGRFTWFMDRKSDNQYIYPILPKRFNRIVDTFYLTDKNEIMVLRDPRQGILCDSSLRYENTLIETKYTNSIPVNLSVNIWRNGFQPYMFADTLFRSDSADLITSFSIDTNLFTVVNVKDRTLIAKLTDGKLKEEYDFKDNYVFVDISKNMDSRNLSESEALLKYQAGKYEMGLISINGYSVHQLHMHYNPDTLEFSGTDHFKTIIDNIKNGWDTLSFQMISDLESKTGSRKVNAHIGNGYIPSSIKDKAGSPHRFIQQVDSSLVVERTYWISEENNTVLACFIDWHLNDAHKDIPDDLFDSVSDAIKEVMGCEAQQTKQKSRKCIMKEWETPAMTLELYPYRSEDNIRIALWRKE